MPRMYRCRGLKEQDILGWSKCFKIGEKYPRVEDGLGLRLLGKHPVTGNKVEMYVEENQFEEVCEAKERYGRVSKAQIIWGFSWSIIFIMVLCALVVCLTYQILKDI